MKKGRRRFVIPVMLLCLLATYFYLLNGRTVLEDRSPPPPEERRQIEEIIDFERRQLAACAALLSRHEDSARARGLELVPVLHSTRAVNHLTGRVEPHDLQAERWLPQYYSSHITCYVYRDGEPLAAQYDNVTSYFVDIFPLVEVRKKEGLVEYSRSPFSPSFDLGVEQLLERAVQYTEREGAADTAE